MPPISLQAVSKTYKHGPLAVDSVDLEIADREFMVLVGPSGCGKSTLLRLIAGIEEVSDGRIMIGERDVTDLDPRKRDVAMVFQSYALYPHLTVAGNLGFGLKLRGAGKDERARRVQEIARVLGLDELLDRKPGQLSGGQRQRVAMGRAIVREPQAFLMDEPLSNLDAKLRVSMRAQLARLHERIAVTTVYVTHDQTEAMTLGSRVAVLRGGVLQQCDTPAQLFEHPANLFVGAFIGSPSMNLVDAVLTEGEARFADWALPLPPSSPLRGFDGRQVILGLRPHDLHLAGPSVDPAMPRVRVRVDVAEELGTETHLVFGVAAPQVRAAELRDAASTSDDAVLLADEAGTDFTAVIGARTGVAAGSEVELAVDVTRLHAFDQESGVALRATAQPALVAG